MRKIWIIIAFIALGSGLKAQQNFTLYYMDRALQSQWVNPSTQSPYEKSVGGLLMPLFGQIPPAIHFNYANNAFKYNDIFHMGTGSKSDSLVLDIPLMMDNKRRANHFRFETHFELLSIGIKVEEMFLSLSLTEKFNYGISLPGDLFELAVNGNKPYMDQGEVLDFRKLNINATHYRELALGMSMQAIEDLRVGARVKFLFGQSNINTKINELSLYTNSDNMYMTAITDMTVQMNTPIPVGYQYYSDGDSAKFELPENPGDFMSSPSAFLNLRNFGVAFDLGGTYTIDNQWEVYLSATDIGFISWNSNPLSLVSQGNFLLRGFESQFWTSEDEIDEDVESFTDSLLNTFHFEGNDRTYFTWLPTNIYIGGKYKLYEQLHIAALYRAEFYKKSLLSSFTLSANANLTNWFTGHLSYSVANNNWTNLGLGFTIRGAFMQYYIVTDNIIGAVWPQKSQNFNVRMGCNLVFGYKKKINSDSLY